MMEPTKCSEDPPQAAGEVEHLPRKRRISLDDPLRRLGGKAGAGVAGSGSIAALVSDLELSLAKCLSDFRREAEDTLTRHLDALEEVEASFEFKQAAIVAENQKLRMMLGIQPETPPQSVLFQASDAQAQVDSAKYSSKRKLEKREKRATIRAEPERDAQKLRGDSEDSMALPARQQLQKSCRGSWQAFLAWVPDGAGLQQPEPWKATLHDGIAQGGQGAPAMQRWASARPCRHGMPAGEHIHHHQPTLVGRLASLASTSHKALTSVMPAASIKNDTSDVTKNDDEDSDTSSEQSDSSTKGGYELSSLWLPTAKEKKHMERERSKRRSSDQSVTTDTLLSRSSQEEQDLIYSSVRPEGMYPLSPDSPVRFSWDLLSLVLVSWDTVYFPLVAFDLPDSQFLTLIDWLIRLFWTGDIAMTCCTAIVNADGTVQYTAKAILLNYARTWLLLDVVVVFADWVSFLISSDGGSISKVVRISKVMRLFRLLRLQEILYNVIDVITPETFKLVGHLGQPLLLVALVLHYTACGWWALGVREGADQTWARDETIDAMDIPSQYLVSVCWALAYFAGSLSEPAPSSSLERFYAILVGLLAFMLTLAMYGSFTSKLTQHHTINGLKNRQMAALKTYLRQNNIAKQLTKRLCRNADHAISGELAAESVDLLGFISEPLKIEMYYEMYAHILSWHPFFKELLFGNSSQQLVRYICYEAMSTLLLTQGDVVFTSGETMPDPKMYIVVHGTLAYTDAAGQVSIVGEKACIAEQMLWLNWRHRGDLVAQSDVKIATLDAQIFQDVTGRLRKKSTEAALPILRYAAAFLEELNETEQPSDLGANFSAPSTPRSRPT